MQSKKRTIISWCFTIFCILALLVYGFNLGTIVMLVLGVCAIPIEPIHKIWDKIPIKGKWFKPSVIGVLFVISIFMIPQDVRDKVNNTQGETTISYKENQNETNLVTTTEEITTTESPTTTTKIEETTQKQEEITTRRPSVDSPTVTLADIPKYSGKPYVAINNNTPYFKDSDLTTSSYEYYSELDSLNRCGVTHACVGKDIMPTEERGNIGQVKPTGWHTVKYDCVDGMYLYNRCHLIGFQLTGENANTKNLITGTRSMNVDGMLPFENMVADYVKETGNHVMYRVTPMFDGDNLLASGVLMEAKSVEDNGDGVLFCVFVYNVQDGVVIDYTSGESSLKEELTTTQAPTTTQPPTTTQKETTTEQQTTIQEQTTTKNNSNNGAMVWISETGSKYHSKNNCGTMNPDKAYQMTKDKAENQGYTACKRCH